MNKGYTNIFSPSICKPIKGLLTLTMHIVFVQTGGFVKHFEIMVERSSTNAASGISRVSQLQTPSGTFK